MPAAHPPAVIAKWHRFHNASEVHPRRLWNDGEWFYTIRPPTSATKGWELLATRANGTVASYTKHATVRAATMAARQHHVSAVRHAKAAPSGRPNALTDWWRSNEAKEARERARAGAVAAGKLATKTARAGAEATRDASIKAACHICRQGGCTCACIPKGSRSALTAAKRAALPQEAFALPGRRYPTDTLARAKNARARAVQALQRGTLSPAQAGEVFLRTAERWGLDSKVISCSRKAGSKRCKSRKAKG